MIGVENRHRRFGEAAVIIVYLLLRDEVLVYLLMNSLRVARTIISCLGRALTITRIYLLDKERDRLYGR